MDHCFDAQTKTQKIRSVQLQKHPQLVHPSIRGRYLARIRSVFVHSCPRSGCRRGAPAVSAALSVEPPETLPDCVDKTTAGSALIQFKPQNSAIVYADIGSECPLLWVDRYVRLALRMLLTCGRIHHQMKVWILAFTYRALFLV